MTEGLYLTRKDMAVLMGVGSDRVGTLDREGRLPCKSEMIRIIDEQGMERRFVRYPKAIMLPWIAKGGHRVEYVKRKSKKAVELPTGITFKRLFAGEFATQEQKEAFTFRKMNARVSRPITKIVSTESDWSKEERSHRKK